MNWLSDFSLYWISSAVSVELPIRNSPFLSGQPIVESTVIIEAVLSKGSANFVLYGTINVPAIVSSERTNS